MSNGHQPDFCSLIGCGQYIFYFKMDTVRYQVIHFHKKGDNSIIHHTSITCKLNFDLYFFQLFAIIVFGCILGEGWHNNNCQMHNDPNACGYGTGIGIIAFLLCLGFLVLDAAFESISSVQYRKYVVLMDMAVSGE